jgi:hypothetical protein
VKFLLVLALGGLSLAQSGCGSCVAKKEVEKPVVEKKGKKAPKKEAVPKTASRDMVPTGTMVAVQVGARSYLWSDSRTGMLSMDTDKLAWSPNGFESPDLGGTKVLAPGGAQYWRFTPGKVKTTPIKDLYAAPGAAPEGYAISADPGKANRIEVTMRGPEGRYIRVGLFPEAPTATTWLQGVLPTGVKVAPRLDKSSGWKLSDDGTAKAEIPDGATPATMTAPSDDRLKGWLADAAKLRGGEVKALWSGVLDLDGDPETEGLLCVSGGKGDYPCLVVDEVGGERRYHAVNLPYDDVSKGAAPIAFAKDGANYVMWLGPVARAPAGSPAQIQTVRFTGAAFQAETIR